MKVVKKGKKEKVEMQERIVWREAEWKKEVWVMKKWFLTWISALMLSYLLQKEKAGEKEKKLK